MWTIPALFVANCDMPTCTTPPPHYWHYLFIILTLFIRRYYIVVIIIDGMLLRDDATIAGTPFRCCGIAPRTVYRTLFRWWRPSDVGGDDAVTLLPPDYIVVLVLTLLLIRYYPVDDGGGVIVPFPRCWWNSLTTAVEVLWVRCYWWFCVWLTPTAYLLFGVSYRRSNVAQWYWWRYDIADDVVPIPII